MKKLVFIRHAETDLAGTFCGRTDPPLNGAGRAQLTALLDGLQEYKIDAVFSSDLQRAIATADAIALSYHAPTVQLQALRELYFGDWEGLRWTEIEARDPVFAGRWTDEYPNLPIPGGEPIQAFRERVLNVVSTLLKDDRHQSAVVVTHAGVLRVVLTELLGLSEEDAWAKSRPYCSHFVYEASR